EVVAGGRGVVSQVKHLHKLRGQLRHGTETNGRALVCWFRGLGFHYRQGGGGWCGDVECRVRVGGDSFDDFGDGVGLAGSGESANNGHRRGVTQVFVSGVVVDDLLCIGYLHAVAPWGARCITNIVHKLCDCRATCVSVEFTHTITRRENDHSIPPHRRQRHRLLGSQTQQRLPQSPYNSHGVPYITGKDGKYVSPVSTTGEYVLAKLDEYIYEEME